MSDRPRAYRFGTAAQWQQLLAAGFDVRADGALQPVARFGSTARRVTTTGPVSLVATDPFGAPAWRLLSNGQAVLVRPTELDGPSRPFELDEVAAASPRWAIDRTWLWVFDASSPIVRRYEADTLATDLTIDLREKTLAAAWAAVPSGARILDLTSDGHGGVWLLLEPPDGAALLVRLDCHGCPRQVWPLPPVECDEHRPVQIGTLRRGARLALLTIDGRVQLVDAATGHVVRTISRWTGDPCWRPVRLATDGAGRMAVLSEYCGDTSRWAVFVLDAEGDLLDAIAGPQQRLVRPPTDVAIAGDVLWLAADDGLWRLDASPDAVAQASERVLLTPALHSPRAGAGGALWLRAELAVVLPPGAVVEAEAVATDDPGLMRRAGEIAADQSRSVAQRQRAVWDLFDRRAARVFHLTTPPGATQPVAVPLFQVQQRWLWLRLTVVTPPGVTPPVLHELRVLYPDASIIQHVPPVFRGAENDPTGFFRSIVGVLEATTQGLDERIASIASHIAPGTAPPEWLDYIARWLDLPWDDALPIDAKRRIVTSGGDLLERRGTRQGLERLLRVLAGPRASVRLVDVTVDHRPMRLGGHGCGPGARLPMLLTGAPRSAPVLGSRTVLGRVCLGAAADPLAGLAPLLRIEIAVPAADRRVLEPLLARVLAQYVPAGVRLAIAWRTTAGWLAAIDADAGEVLDATGPGRLGDDSEIGRMVLTGRRVRRLDGLGHDVGFRLS